MVTRLQEQGELPGASLDDYYVTFLAGIIRSVRFGAGTAHGRANAAEFSFLRDHGAFVRDSASGRYRVDLGKMRAGVDSMAAQILRLQGDGDYAGVTAFLAERGAIAPDLQSDLDRLATRKIPVDVVFEQGPGRAGTGAVVRRHEPEVIDSSPRSRRSGSGCSRRSWCCSSSRERSSWSAASCEGR